MFGAFQDIAKLIIWQYVVFHYFPIDLEIDDPE